MRRIVSILGLCVASTASAAPNLSVTGTCPGPVNVTITGLTPGGNYYLARSQNAGVGVIPGGPCAGTEFRLNPAGPGWSVSSLVAPASGTATFAVTLPPAMCNRRFEVVDVGSCTVSNVWDFTYPQCNPASVFLATAADHASLASCQTLNDVYVSQPGLVGPSSVASINFPTLVHLGAMISVGAGPLASVALPAVRRVHQTISLADSPSVTSFTAPLWGGASEVLHFSPTALPSLSLPSLEGLGVLEATVNGPVSLPSLTVMDTLFLDGAWTTLNLGALDDLNFATLTSSAATSIDLGSLQQIGDGVSPHTEYVYISNNPMLSSVDVGSLSDVTNFYMFANPMLCPASMTALYPDWMSITLYGQLVVAANQPGCYEVIR